MKYTKFSKSFLFLAFPLFCWSLNQHDGRSFSRRVFVTTTSTTATTGAGIFVVATANPSLPAVAATPLTAGEAIRQGAAGLPGYGQPDVYFPSSVRGTWKMTRLVEFPNSQKRLELEYPIRFVTSVRDEQVVADRGINQSELEKALRRSIITDGSNGGFDDGQIISYDWSITNPNDLRLTWKTKDGQMERTKEIKVTKRATECTADIVTSSEFQRIVTTTQQPDGREIPDISARRVLTKWNIINTDDGPNRIEGTEIVYSIPTAGDPMAAASSSGGSSTTPTVLSKSQFYLVR